MWLMVLALLLAFAIGGGARAQQVSLDGYLIALQACEANKKKDSDNPGDLRLEVLHAYEMIGRNATPGTHYQVKVPGAPETEARWVPMSCGAFASRDSLVLAGEAAGDGRPVSRRVAPAPDSVENVLAASWQPGFCATRAGQGKTECRTQTADRPDATQFSVHGLWPDDLDDKAIFPCYCGRAAPISCSLTRGSVGSIDLDPDILAALEVAMPGVQSNLHLHEWAKHGTCYEKYASGNDAGADPNEFYRETMALLAQLNASPVRDLFLAHLGQELTGAEIRSAFDEAFGAGAGERVLVRCDRDTGVITEMWIGLGGDISVDSDLADLLLAAPPASASANTANCAGGRVVEVTD